MEMYILNTRYPCGWDGDSRGRRPKFVGELQSMRVCVYVGGGERHTICYIKHFTGKFSIPRE